MIKFFTCLFLAAAFVMSIVSLYKKITLLASEKERGANMLRLLNKHLTPPYKIVLFCQAYILLVIPVAIVALTIKSLTLDQAEMLKMSVCAILATAALLLGDNMYYKKVIEKVLFCLQQEAAERSDKK